MTIADVIMWDGSKLTKHALDVSHLLQATSKLDWPNKCPCNQDILCLHKGLCLTQVKHSIHVRFVKDKGHKTDFIPFAQLSRPKQLNKLMDTCTKAWVTHIFSEQIPAPPNNTKFEGWSCWIDNTKITSDPTKQIMQQIHYDTMRHFLARSNHFHMSTTGFDLVD
jgi:hypothetical protein